MVTVYEWVTQINNRIAFKIFIDIVIKDQKKFSFLVAHDSYSTNDELLAYSLLLSFFAGSLLIGIIAVGPLLLAATPTHGRLELDEF